RLRIAERLEDGGVHDREDGRVRADSEAEREHGNDGESGTLAERPARVAKVLNDLLESPFQICLSPSTVMLRERVASRQALASHYLSLQLLGASTMTWLSLYRYLSASALIILIALPAGAQSI